jgi:UDP-N-acetylmuramate dehydrogenase
LGVGGCARYFLEAREETTVREAIEWAATRHLDLYILGGGSNLVVADDGVDGLVLKIGLRGITARADNGTVAVTVGAGEPWDAFVHYTVARGWTGLECLSGIPGLVGATPVQNVGAYGQQVSDTLIHVRAFDRRSGSIAVLSPDECAFAYRDSALKSRDPGRYIVLAVSYRLALDRAPAIRYGELASHLERRGVRSPSLAEVRASVLDIRRSKSMVLDASDENRRSCGSFFLNPLVAADHLRRLEQRGLLDATAPRWPDPDGRVKLSAAWLIERAGFRRGQREGAVGLSSRHALAIVCHKGARARDVAAFAERVQARVADRFGVWLKPEPVFWGGIGQERRDRAAVAPPDRSPG